MRICPSRVRLGSRTLLCSLTAGACLAGAAPASAASVVANKRCYHEREPILFSAFGYTPGGFVDIRRDGVAMGALRAAANGVVVGTLPAPVVDPARVRPFALEATDRANPALSAQIAPPPLSSVIEVRVRPTGGRPDRRRRISARGFTSGRRLYAHVRRRGRGHDVSLGRLGQPCGTKSRRARIFRRGTRRGTYKVQFDTFRRYSAARRPRVTFTVTVLPVARGARARAALNPFERPPAPAERWVRVR